MGPRELTVAQHDGINKLRVLVTVFPLVGCRLCGGRGDTIHPDNLWTVDEIRSVVHAPDCVGGLLLAAFLAEEGL